MNTIVSLVKSPKDILETPFQYTEKSLLAIQQLLGQALNNCVNLGQLVSNKTVLIKPNLVRPDPEKLPGITTDPRVILALCRLVKESGAREVAMGDNPGYGLSLRNAVQSLQLEDPLNKLGVKICYLDEMETVEQEIPGAMVFKKVHLPKPLTKVEVLINVPKMKTHMHTLVSLGIKNMHGIVLDCQRMVFHRNDLHWKLVDIIRAVYPTLTIIDGIWALEGQAPLYGKLIKGFNVVVAGRDVVATDAVASAVMGIAPQEVTTIRLAESAGLGQGNLNKIEIVGSSIEEVRRFFQRPVLSSMGAFPNIEVIEGGACSGCLSALRHALDKLSIEGRLKNINPLTIYVGKLMPNVLNLDCNRERDLWCFGNCSVDLVYNYYSSHGPLAHFIPGCAPHILDLYREFCNHYCL
jgi:uncharacterized protein (DUF362 family)